MTKLKNRIVIAIFIVIIGVLAGCLIKTVFLLNEKNKELEAIEPEEITEEVVDENIETTDEDFTMTEYEEIEHALKSMQNEIDEIEWLVSGNLLNWYIEFHEIEKKYEDYFGSMDTIYDYFTDEDIYLIERAVETETYQCDFENKVNVATVILNRVESDLYPDTVDKVVVDGQFAFGRKNISDDTILAVEYAFQFGGACGDALYFQSAKYMDRFCGADFVYYDGAHWFYSVNKGDN